MGVCRRLSGRRFEKSGALTSQLIYDFGAGRLPGLEY